MAALDEFAQNRLLAALPDEEARRLAPEFELVPRMDVREPIYEAGEPVESVWFPLTSVFSLVSEMADGRAVEVATVGREGFVGLPVFLQGSYTSAHMAFCQIPGEALRIGAGRFGDRVSDSAVLHGLLHRYTLALVTQIGQSSACNRLHTLAQRCARWILMMHDRVGSDEFTLTQEFLAQMLGVRRASVNEVMQDTQERGLVSYSRGRVTVTDRAGLEAAACECYDVIRLEYERLVGASASG